MDHHHQVLVQLGTGKNDRATGTGQSNEEPQYIHSAGQLKFDPQWTHHSTHRLSGLIHYVECKYSTLHGLPLKKLQTEGVDVLPLVFLLTLLLCVKGHALIQHLTCKVPLSQCLQLFQPSPACTPLTLD